MHAADAIHDLPALGVGLGFRSPFRADLFRDRSAVDFLEITADHYFEASPEKLEELDLLEDHFILIPHGLSLSLGSAEGLDVGYADALAALVRRLDPPWWSEHLAFTHAGGVDIGHLAPLPFTREAIDAVARNVESMRRRIDVPLLLENITYSVTLPGSELDEAAFLAEVLERTGCGLLLDVTNLYTNAVNLGYDWRRFLDRLPLERVVQLHFTGGHRRGGAWVDSHSQRTPEEVWEVLDAVLERAPVRGAILERDENLPPFVELRAEVERAREAGRRHGRWGSKPSSAC